MNYMKLALWRGQPLMSYRLNVLELPSKVSSSNKMLGVRSRGGVQSWGRAAHKATGCQLSPREKHCSANEKVSSTCQRSWRPSRKGDGLSLRQKTDSTKQPHPEGPATFTPANPFSSPVCLKAPTTLRRIWHQKKISYLVFPFFLPVTHLVFLGNNILSLCFRQD